MKNHTNFTQGKKEWDNPPNIISKQEVANLKAQAKRLFENENIRVERHRGIAWDNVENPDPKSAPQVLPSSEEYTPLKVPTFDEPEPQPQPLPNYPPLDVSLGSERGLKPPIEPHSLYSFRMKLLDNLTIRTPHSSLVASFHPKDMYCYYHPSGSESRPPMLNKENYVPWSSRLLRYAKSRPNGKLILNSILNGPYVRKMIPEPGDANREINVTETFHLQIEADDQAIQTILLGLPEDIYAAVDSWESIESYYHRFLKLMNVLKRNKHFPEKIASNLKFLNNLQPEWSRHVTIVHQTKDLHTADYTQLYDFLKYNQKEVDELKAERIAKTQDPLALMANFKNPYAFPAPHQDQPSFNQNYLQQPILNPEDITDLTTAMNMALALMAKAFKLNYSTPTNNNQRISSNPRNRHIA
nr:hypothetical protein [Tanacetum cinerariifolium]